MKSARNLIALGVAMIILAAGALWWAGRENDCRLLQRQAFGDVKIVRDASGRCYACRDDGWLYDIAYKTCPTVAKGD